MYTHTLLLVDDSITVQQEIRSALAGEPIQVVVAVNGHRALDQIEATRPDVVLASTVAQGVNGYGLAHYVSQRPYLSRVAVLLVTETVSPADTHRMRQSGARGFICHPIEPGIVRARVKEVLTLSAPDAGQSDVLGQLATAFDAIDASMTSNVFGGLARPNEIAITPEALARIVNDAVTQAIAAYEKERNLTPAPLRDSLIGGGQGPRVAPSTPGRLAHEQLQREMGLDDIGFEPAPPAESVDYAALTAEMGVDDFAFEEHESTRPVEASEPRKVVPDPFAAPRLVPPDPGPPAEVSDASVTSVLEPLRDAVVSLGTALADQANRFRSALAERGRLAEDERGAGVQAATPAPQPVQAPAPVEPVPAEPAPLPQPPRPSLERLAAMTPEEAAKSVFFTFDPVPPVPPPIPREPHEP
ncbi:MAG: response regulator [Acidobacteriota bacterium]|nr:response regulator [Acidobacteriota bacterium]